MTRIILCFLLLTFNPFPAQSQPVKTTMPPGWYEFVVACCEKYGVDPCKVLAVFEVESSGEGQRFRFGKMGRGTYWGPAGIHKSFLKKWRIDDPYINTEIGIRALARYKDFRKSLRKYNASFDQAYYRRIKQLERRNREEMK